jgi:hypothetical protein
MTNIISLTVARANLSELINQAFYEGKMFGVSKGSKQMGVFVGSREWNQIIETLEMHDQGLADTLAIMADPELQEELLQGEKDAKKGNVISWDEVVKDAE